MTTCAHCGVEFVPSRKRETEWDRKNISAERRYCGPPCCWAARKGRPNIKLRKPETQALYGPRPCEGCGVVYTPPDSAVRGAKARHQTKWFHDKACYARWLKGQEHPERQSDEVNKLLVPTTCGGCGRVFRPTRRQAINWKSAKNSTGKFCSPSCWTSTGLGPKIAFETGRAGSCSILGAPRTNDYRKREQHPYACFYRLRAPWRKTYTFRNLTNFVREHPQFFDARDLIERPYKPGSVALHPCNATSRLGELFRIRKDGRQIGSWKGWVAVWKKDKLGKITWRKS